jgi:16S rRNA (cytidine1402-2'-O)-methyltransferase
MNSGKLYVIGTPIGNLGDITLRAIETLGKIEVLYCEDSRVSSRLINYLQEKNFFRGKPRYIPYNEFNEKRVWESVVTEVARGKQVGLVSDAGMPAISDPGYCAIKGCLEEKLEVEIIPGVTALTTALPWSGMGGEVMIYVGFLPKSSGKARRVLEGAYTLMTKLPSTRVVLYVSPHRLVKDLELIKDVMGEVKGVLMRELTKMHQERREGMVEELIKMYQAKSVKGELVLVLQKGESE